MEEKIKSLVEHSELPDEDKHLWDEFLDLTDEKQQEVLVDFLEDDEDKLLFLTDNLKMKREALESGDPQLIDKILDQEEEALMEL